MRYSIRDTIRDADREALTEANACSRTLVNLTEDGRECADVFGWFDVFQTRLINHVNRVCRVAVRNSAKP
jgi:hypothetical protein